MLGLAHGIPAIIQGFLAGSREFVKTSSAMTQDEL